MKDPLFYKITRPLLALFIRLYRPTIINKEYIPKKGRIILAGNHTNYYDCLLLGLATKRCVHYLAKKELATGIKKPIMMGLGIIPVDRKIKDKDALNKGIEALNNDLVIGIFPEGTINKTKEIIMPFKFGAVKMAEKTDTLIIPFSITGKYKLFKKSVKLVLGKPFKTEEDIEKSNEELMSKVTKLILDNKVEELCLTK